MSRHMLEPVLDQALVKHLTDPKFLTGVLESHFARMQEDHMPSADELVRARVESLRKQRKRVIDAFIALNIDHVEKEQRLSEIDNELDSLRAVESIEKESALDPDQIVRIVRVFRDWTHLGMNAKREIMTRVIPEIFVHRYVVGGVSLRIGYNSANRPKTAAEVITSHSDLTPYRETPIYIPFTEEVFV